MANDRRRNIIRHWMAEKLGPVADVFGVLEGSGLKQLLTLLGSALGGALVVALGWALNVAPGLLIIIFILAFAVLVWSVAKITQIIANARLALQAKPIDAQALADEATSVSEEMFRLLAEYRGPLHIAWHEDCNAERGARTRYATVEGQLLLRYGNGLQARVLAVILTAHKVLNFDKGELWSLNRTASGKHDIEEMALKLAQIGVDLRYAPSEDKRDG